MTVLFRPRPLCGEGRAEIRARVWGLVAEAEALEREHEVRAARMGEIRRELTMLRDATVNVAPGRRTRFRKARVPGPAPVGRPAPPAVPVRGRDLRHAALGVLMRAGGPMSLPEIHRGLHAAGFAVDGWHPVKQPADALGWEHDKGRARRVARGVYEIGQLSPYRRRRALLDATRVGVDRSRPARAEWDRTGETARHHEGAPRNDPDNAEDGAWDAWDDAVPP